MKKITLTTIYITVLVFIVLMCVFIPKCYTINDEESLKIREAYLDMRNKRGANLSTDDIRIEKYYGTYNQCIVAMLTDSDAIYSQMLRKEKIAGIDFIYSDSNQILVLHDDTLYTLEEAYILNILTKKNIRSIRNAYIFSK